VWLFGAPSQKETAMAETIAEHVKQQNGTTEGLKVAMSPSFAEEIWPIRRLLSQIRFCDIIVGPDTGPMWSVAMESVPKIMLLSHASPENITKYWRNTTTLHADQSRVDCWPCHRLIDSPDHCRVNASGNAAACISDISVETIVSTISETLKGSQVNVRNGLGAAPEGVRPSISSEGTGASHDGKPSSPARQRRASQPAPNGRGGYPS